MASVGPVLLPLNCLARLILLLCKCEGNRLMCNVDVVGGVGGGLTGVSDIFQGLCVSIKTVALDSLYCVKFHHLALVRRASQQNVFVIGSQRLSYTPSLRNTASRFIGRVSVEDFA